MATFTTRLRPTGNSLSLASILQRISPQLRLQQGAFFSLLTVLALVAFEIFNFSTTEFALTDLIGDLQFSSVRWATILALAFTGMDFAGIARLFTPQKRSKQSLESWYLLGAWLLAATMNAILTWWAISLALLEHQALGNEIVSREGLLSSVPVFVAVLVWLIRILMIGSFTLSSAKKRKQHGAQISRQGDDHENDISEEPSESTVFNRRPHPKPKRS